MTLMWIDDKTFEVIVKHAPNEGFIPTEESIAIVKFSQMIKKQMDDFIKEKHNPMVQKLLDMVAAFNIKNNPEYAAMIEKQRMVVEKKPLKSKKASLNKK